MIIGTQINGSVFSLKCKCRNKHCNAALCDYISASKQNHIYRKMFLVITNKTSIIFWFPWRQTVFVWKLCGTNFPSFVFVLSKSLGSLEIAYHIILNYHLYFHSLFHIPWCRYSNLRILHTYVQLSTIKNYY